MPLSDSTKSYNNKENTMTPKHKLPVHLEGKMREPMEHKVEVIKQAVSSSRIYPECESRWKFVFLKFFLPVILE